MIHDEEDILVWLANLFVTMLNLSEEESLARIRTDANDFYEPASGYIVFNIDTSGNRESSGPNYSHYNDDTGETVDYMRKYANVTITAYGKEALAQLQEFDFRLDSRRFDGDKSFDKSPDSLDIGSDFIGDKTEKIGILSGVVRYIDFIIDEAAVYADSVTVTTVEDNEVELEVIVEGFNTWE
jgi:hypothetical protein